MSVSFALDYVLIGLGFCMVLIALLGDRIQIGPIRPGYLEGGQKLTLFVVGIGFMAVAFALEGVELEGLAVTSMADRDAVVFRQDLNLRANPWVTAGNIVTEMPRGARVSVGRCEADRGCKYGGEWCQVTYRQYEGWACGGFLQEAD